MILLGSVPKNIKVHQVEKTLKAVEGVSSVHSVMIWRLTEAKCVVTAHVVVEPHTVHKEGGRVSEGAVLHTVPKEGGRVSEGAAGNALLGRLVQALHEVLTPAEIHSMTLQVEAHNPCDEDGTTDQVPVA